MRASDLIGLPVVGPDGRHYGEVLDVRLVQDGPLVGAFAALRVVGLVVGHHKVAAHLGYDRARVNAPWLVNAVVQRITRRNAFLPWDQAVVEDGCVRTERSELEPVRQLAGG
ncbi:MAG: PRC-barrel domain-containing protein [Actinomycetota bacterium]|nr:PRC-barrel domain-containing protein [Actinomycetota bacterium]